MSYEKQNFKDGEVLTAEQLNRMEEYFQHCPQCYSEYGLTELLPETALVFNEDMSAMPLYSEVKELTVGNTYTVTWNNVEYETVAQEMYDESAGASAILLGNLGAMTGGESTGEPFVLIYNPEAFGGETGYYGIFAPLDGSTEATVKIIGIGEIVHKLPEKYLPDTLPEVVVLTAFGGYCEKNSNEIIEMYNTLGIRVMFLMADRGLALLQYAGYENNSVNPHATFNCVRISTYRSGSEDVTDCVIHNYTVDENGAITHRSFKLDMTETT